MAEFFKWLSNSPMTTVVFIVFIGALFISVTVLYIIAFFQGRAIFFWPPKIGQKPKFPTLAVILLIVGVLWIINDLTIVKINIPWFPLILTVVSIGMIVNRYSKA